MEANFRLKNNSSVLAREDDYEWFIIVNPVLIEKCCLREMYLEVLVMYCLEQQT